MGRNQTSIIEVNHLNQNNIRYAIIRRICKVFHQGSLKCVNTNLTTYPPLGVIQIHHILTTFIKTYLSVPMWCMLIRSFRKSKAVTIWSQEKGLLEKTRQVRGWGHRW